MDVVFYTNGKGVNAIPESLMTHGVSVLALLLISFPHVFNKVMKAIKDHNYILLRHSSMS